MGVPSVFIRTSGCNLRCAWCDTPYTSWQPEGAELSLEQILDEVAAHPARHVVVTGGEPMIAPEIVAAHRAAARARPAHHHRDRGHGVPAGGLRPDEHQPQAGQLHARRAAWAAQHERLRIQPDVLAELMARYEYQLKFVIAAAGGSGRSARAGASARAPTASA